MTYTVYYDYYDGKEVPIWFVIPVKSLNLLDYEQDTVTISIHAPFNKQGREAFDPNAMNVTITMNDLLLTSIPHSFGISLSNVKKRLDEYGVLLEDIDSFILLVADVEEVLQLQL
ncbi:hypothetical protein [Shouchella lehensis]|uniref:Uncharacterized protein n=1 Tax=Shouchella lehensis G1 TaxID=1246626 RepID=A0A060LY58_9BACI|nr:hypothetical protein [Shouchella lehensis]AIC92749.1 hypothetical protein BleG1_0134 [Shouchella lehensis G1]